MHGFVKCSRTNPKTPNFQDRATAVEAIYPYIANVLSSFSYFCKSFYPPRNFVNSLVSDGKPIVVSIWTKQI